MNTSRLQHCYQYICEAQQEGRNANIRLESLPKNDLFVVRLFAQDRPFQVWTRNGQVFKVTTSIEGAEVDTQRVNHMLQSGYTIGQAISNSITYNVNNIPSAVGDLSTVSGEFLDGSLSNVSSIV